jgi:probable HAF family extracellular repeat protein
MDATGINDNGWIIGNVTNTIKGVTHAYLLTAAVPEPDSYVMALIGLGFIGFVALRSNALRA